MHTKVRPTLCEWRNALQASRSKGVILCPFMTQPPGKNLPELCGCDIPQTRTHFIEEHGTCSNEQGCLPRILTRERASAELNPRPR